MTVVWNTVNGKIKLASVFPDNLRIGDIYIVDYVDINDKEKYRAKLISIIPGSQEKYKVKFCLIILNIIILAII